MLDRRKIRVDRCQKPTEKTPDSTMGAGKHVAVKDSSEHSGPESFMRGKGGKGGKGSKGKGSKGKGGKGGKSSKGKGGKGGEKGEKKERHRNRKDAPKADGEPTNTFQGTTSSDVMDKKKSTTKSAKSFALQGIEKKKQKKPRNAEKRLARQADRQGKDRKQ